MLARISPRGVFYSVGPLFVGKQSFTDFDPEIFALNELGVCHQIQSLELSEPEGFASASTLRAVATQFEGSPWRPSGDRQILTELTSLCGQRALAAFDLDSSSWSVGIHPIPADIAVAHAVLPPHGRVIGLPAASAWQSKPHALDRRTRLIDTAALSRQCQSFRPHLIVAGGYGYTRNIDYAAFRRAADACGALLMANLAQAAPLVSAGIAPSPFAHCDIVVATAQRASRSDLVFHRRGRLPAAVAAALRGGASIPQTAAVAVAMREAAMPEFKQLQHAVVRNMRRLAEYLTRHGVMIATGGTDHHIAKVEIEDGEATQWVLDCANIATTACPGGITIGSPALTQRGLGEVDFEQVGDFLVSGMRIAADLRKRHPAATFRAAVARDAGVEALKREVVSFARQFPLQGNQFTV